MKKCSRGRTLTSITDEDVLLAQREECLRKNLCFIDDCRKCPVSAIFDRVLYSTVVFDSAVEGTETERKKGEAERARDEAIIAACKGEIGAMFIELLKHDGSHGEDCTSCHEGRPKNECPESKRKCGHHCNHSWSHDICCWCGQEFGENYTDEDTDTDKLICSNCSFASKSDVRVFPAGISSSIPLPGEVLYCPERDTRVPGTLEGCELHSERKKDDEVNSLDNTIDECFREMERLIGDMEFPDKSEIGIKFCQHGYPVPIFLPTIEQLRKTITYQQSSPEERLKMEERLASDRRKIVELAELIPEVDQLRKEAAITKRIRAERDALRVCNERLKRDNDKLRDENKILQQEVALLKSKRKKDSGYIASLEIKISKIKKELSGKWRLLEAGEAYSKDDRHLHIESYDDWDWDRYPNISGTKHEDSSIAVRKITI